MPQKKRKGKSAGAAVSDSDVSDSDENEETHSNDGGKEKAPTALTKNVEKSATASALEEVESLSHEAMPSPPSGPYLLLLQNLLRNLLLLCNQSSSNLQVPTFSIFRPT